MRTVMVLFKKKSMIFLKYVPKNKQKAKMKYQYINYLSDLLHNPTQLQLIRTRTDIFQWKQLDNAVPLVKVDEDIMNR